MRALIIILSLIFAISCSDNKGSLENCADEEYKNDKSKDDAVLRKSYKNKMKDSKYFNYHFKCEKFKKMAPETFDARYQ